MNILNLLSKKRDIVGVEISDQVIRVAYFRPRYKNNDTKNLPSHKIILKETKIPENIISGGIVLDKNGLEQILKKVWEDEHLEKYYAVISIEEGKIYSYLLSIPKDVIYAKLPEAVSLAIDFQIPLKKESFYSGWELNKNGRDANQILVSVISKKIIDDYTEAFEKANINILAIESHLSSIIRAIDTEKEKIILVKSNSKNTTLFYIKDKFLQFSRTIPNTFSTGDNFINQEIEKIKNSFSFTEKEPIDVLYFDDGKIIDKYNEYPEIAEEKDSKTSWIISIGALDRGEIPQGQDDQICLLPVNMTKAYSYQKTKIFTILIRNIIIVVSLFFVFMFTASYLFMSEIKQKIGVGDTALISPISNEITNKESLIAKVNSLTEASNLILQTTPNWSILIDEIKNRTVSGIIITNLSIPNINDKISITGIAANREVLNKFKKSIQDSDYLSEIELPITNLEQKGDIPFSISFKIKDPQVLYYK